jgi:hypothetical protein
MPSSVQSTNDHAHMQGLQFVNDANARGVWSQIPVVMLSRTFHARQSPLQRLLVIAILIPVPFQALARPCPPGSPTRGPHCSLWRGWASAGSAGPPGASLAPGPLPCGGTGCNGLSWNLVFWALPGATGGGPGAFTTQWDGGNRQTPPGRPPRRRTDSLLHHLFWVGTSWRC